MARGRTQRREAELERLAPVISGTLSSKDRGLRGIYRGHDVEARVSKHDPTPSGVSGSTSPDEVTVFHLRIGDVAGREPWMCSRQPRLKPFAAPEYVFDWSYGGLGPLDGLLGKVVDLPDRDLGLEQRLRETGLLETIDGFGHGSSSFLPRVRYTPALHSQMGQSGELLCEVELGRDTVPAPEAFGELLDRALQIVEINSRANPAS